MRSLVPFLALALLAAGCGSEPAAPPPADGAARGPALLAFETPAPPPARDPGPADGGALRFTLPEGWESMPTSSPVRLAQARIPGPGGEANLVVYWFGEGGGGSAEESLQRWLGEIDPAPGAVPVRERFAANGLAVSWVDATGTLLPNRMGTGPATPQPGSRLLGAVIEGPGGPWFVKATGPEATLAAARADFLALLATAQAAPRP
ncbi:MAG TPA: hypothetical protein P5199_12940 [Thermoanaerobaculia bacterium]|nr:MAG: hypothetical protein BWX64_01897 [Acidobacteria bacterium ADurb.Bin051]HRS37377.1 hypothetical protein [Thermoanaerobaculia bacterium]